MNNIMNVIMHGKADVNIVNVNFQPSAKHIYVLITLMASTILVWSMFVVALNFLAKLRVSGYVTSFLVWPYLQ